MLKKEYHFPHCGILNTLVVQRANKEHRDGEEAINTCCEAVVVTHHAQWRAAQRNVSSDAMRLVVQYGRHHHAARATHCFFGRREAKRWRPILGRIVESLDGIVVVLARDEVSATILTTYRNERAMRKIRRKPAYWLRKVSAEG